MATGKQLASDQGDMISSSMSEMREGLLVFAGIALFVGMFIIANTFTMLVAQRTKELALLRAVGASRRQVTRSVLVEAFVVDTVAGVTGLVAGIGIGIGIGIGAGLHSLMGSFDATVPEGPLVITPGTIGVALAVGIVITMLAAWLPGRRAAKIPPVAAMSSVHAKATTKLEDIWEHSFNGDARLVDACVMRLHAKIEEDPRRPAYVQTVRGFGYRFGPLPA